MSPIAQRQLTPETAFGRYVIHERIARGGMGEVWLATARGPNGFQKRVVIKTILPDLAGRSDYVAMLVNEASLAARLNHPNIVQVFDFDCVDGLYFMAMEYLSGRTIAQVMQRSVQHGVRVPPWVALTVIAACCEGLQYAHDFPDDKGRPLGLVHRDMSPGNVMISFAGNVTIVDFGIAVATRNLSGLRSKTLKGKYRYMPPERVHGNPGDRRCDVYALGVMLYELLTFVRPFRGDSDGELLRNIVSSEPPPPSRHAPWISPALDAVVMRAMAPDLDRRYPDARQLAVDLRACMRHGEDEPHEIEELAAFMRGLFPDGQEIRPDMEDLREAPVDSAAAACLTGVGDEPPGPDAVVAPEEDALIEISTFEVEVDLAEPEPVPAPPPASVTRPVLGQRPQRFPRATDLKVEGTPAEEEPAPVGREIFAAPPVRRPVGQDVFASAPRTQAAALGADGEDKWPWPTALKPLANGRNGKQD